VTTSQPEAGRKVGKRPQRPPEEEQENRERQEKECGRGEAIAGGANPEEKARLTREPRRKRDLPILGGSEKGPEKEKESYRVHTT